MEEIWKPITGYEGLYEVSNLGRVKRMKWGRWIITLGYFSQSKYKKVDLFKNKERKVIFIHRLVAKAFIQNPENKPFVNHKDSKRDNNNVHNLEWCTQKENIRHALEKGNMKKPPHIFGEAHHSAKLKETDVLFIRNYKVKDEDDKKFLSKKYNITIRNINGILSGKIWKHLQQ